MITDGVLAHGVTVGRFVFQDERLVVYAITDLLHVGNSDTTMIYQISKSDYNMLMARSLPDRVPAHEVPAKVTNLCHRNFLCGESAYCKRDGFKPEHVDMALVDKL